MLLNNNNQLIYIKKHFCPNFLKKLGKRYSFSLLKKIRYIMCIILVLLMISSHDGYLFILTPICVHGNICGKVF